jgi:hypothetical protein
VSYPIPHDWQPEDPVEATAIFLRNLPGLPEPGREELLAEVKKICAKYSRKNKRK